MSQDLSIRAFEITNLPIFWQVFTCGVADRSRGCKFPSVCLSVIFFLEPLSDIAPCTVHHQLTYTLIIDRTKYI